MNKYLRVVMDKLFITALSLLHTLLGNFKTENDTIFCHMLNTQKTQHIRITFIQLRSNIVLIAG